MVTDKITLRKKIIEQRLEMSPAIAKSAAIALSKRLLEIIPYEVNVAGYSTIRGEIDVAIAIADLAARGNKTALPVIVKGSKILKFLEYTPNSPLVAGNFSIPTPPPHTPEIIPEVLIVPMVGFDKNNYRLGYGGGYYDATLARLRTANKNLLVIGVAYAFQKLEHLEVEPHDQKMDMVVTEEGIIR